MSGSVTLAVAGSSTFGELQLGQSFIIGTGGQTVGVVDIMKKVAAGLARDLYIGGQHEIQPGVPVIILVNSPARIPVRAER